VPGVLNAQMLELASLKRIVLGLAAAAAIALFVSSSLPQMLAMAVYVGVFHNLFPSAVSWDGHEAFVKCGTAIANPNEWPSTPAAACQAMHMCADKAPLSDRQKELLSTQIRGTPSCQE